MKPVMNKLRLLGMLSIIYIDDLIFVNKILKKCLKNIHDAINLLESLDFIINFKKSSLIPNQKCKYLGFIINAIDYTLNLTDKKKIQIVELCKSFEVQRYYKIREFAKLLGVLTAACLAVTYGSIHCKRLERQKFLSLIINDKDYEGKIFINEAMREDLNWWQ